MNFIFQSQVLSENIIETALLLTFINNDFHDNIQRPKIITTYISINKTVQTTKR